MPLSELATPEMQPEEALALLAEQKRRIEMMREIEESFNEDADVIIPTIPAKSGEKKERFKLSEPNLKDTKGKLGWAPARYELVIEAQKKSIQDLQAERNYIVELLAKATGLQEHDINAAITARELTITEV